MYREVSVQDMKANQASLISNSADSHHIPVKAAKPWTWDSVSKLTTISHKSYYLVTKTMGYKTVATDFYTLALSLLVKTRDNASVSSMP